MKGEVLNEPTGYNKLIFHNHTGYLYSWLYQVTNGINWHGVFMLLYIYIALFNINALLYHITKNSGNRRWYLFMLLSLSLYWSYIVENVYLINYARTALLLSFSSLACIIVLYKNYYKADYFKYYVLFYLLLFFLGWNTRFTLVMVFSPIVIFFIWTYLPKRKALITGFTIILFVFLYMGFSWLILSEEQKVDISQTIQTERYIVNILDGFNRNPNAIKTQQDSIKLVALNMWFFADMDTVLNIDFLAKVEDNPLKPNRLAEWKTNLKAERDKAADSYTKAYLPGLEWWWKTKFMILILILLPIIMFATGRINKIGLRKVGGFVIASLAYILAFTILIKMEDRALAPTLIFILLGVLLLAQKKRTKNNISTYFLILCMAAISIGRTNSYLDNSRQRAIDLQKKHSIQSELVDKFSNKTVLFDLYTTTILETSVLKDAQYPDNWISIRGVWNRHYKAHTQKLEAMVGCVNWPCFLDTISQRPDEFVLFHLEKRTKLIYDYCRIIYDQEYRFNELPGPNKVNDLHYSMHWLPFKLRYYSVEKINTDSLNIDN